MNGTQWHHAPHFLVRVRSYSRNCGVIILQAHSPSTNQSLPFVAELDPGCFLACRTSRCEGGPDLAQYLKKRATRRGERVAQGSAGRDRGGAWRGKRCPMFASRTDRERSRVGRTGPPGTIPGPRSRTAES